MTNCGSIVAKYGDRSETQLGSWKGLGDRSYSRGWMDRRGWGHQQLLCTAQLPEPGQ
ncbi:hypothetical protein [Microbulbifer sp. SSSA005]|uniref:hypothetical protein n=1 Tax=Microbulbifer sp. SSSA005 TaxID=3243378 RepID=UPI00403944F7